MPAQSPPRRRRTWFWSVALLGLLAAALLVWLLRERPVAEAPPSAAAPRATGSSAPGPRAERSTESKAEEAAPAPREVRAALPPFTGRVLSGADGRGIAGAEVTFFAPEGATSVRSGPDGRFQLVPSRAGPHQLAAVLAEGYVPFGPEWGQSPIRLVAPAPPGTPELVLSLEPEIRLKGRVEAQDGGAPIGGATVTLRLPGSQPGVLSSERRWTTDGRGEFSGPAPGEGMLLAQAAGFAPAVEPLRGTGETRTVTLRLKAASANAAPEPPLAGRVVDDRGAPVPDAVVTLGVTRRPREGGSVLPAPVASDAQGRFRFEAVPAQVGWAQARAGDLLSERVGVEPGQAEVVLTVHPGGVLAGRVVHSDGRPATAFALQLVRLRRGEPSRTLSVVDPDGQWEVRGLASGAWELQALAADSGPSERVPGGAPGLARRAGGEGAPAARRPAADRCGAGHDLAAPGRRGEGGHGVVPGRGLRPGPDRDLHRRRWNVPARGRAGHPGERLGGGGPLQPANRHRRPRPNTGGGLAPAARRGPDADHRPGGHRGGGEPGRGGSGARKPDPLGRRGGWRASTPGTSCSGWMG